MAQNNRKIDNDEKKLRDDFKRTFNSPHGQSVYRHMIERCHIFNSTFTGSSKTFFLEGERNIGLYLLSMMDLASSDGLEVIREMENDA